ncbi:putative pectinesterase/pectinesterase inhibitor 28 [Cucurbita maxima]|uniref:Pectinesterase n=1 Tax=Cucurbita maxima TaxID=3661 RepID=A0A6J1HU87_CUCMA|nr:putative pectinesterase/pectinesterase inhibitor 28 [Cucurbita maxima]
MAYDEDDSGNNKRYAIIGVSSMLLVAMVVAVTVGVNLNNDEAGGPTSGTKSNEISASVKAIKSICQTTDYKKDCVDSLKSNANNSADPHELVKAGFKAAMKLLQAAAKQSVTLQQLEQDPRASQALAGCKELMDFAIDELKFSMSRFGDFDTTHLDEMLIDLKIWLSATITYQETCLDSFENTTGDASEKMKKALKTSMRLSSNGLAMVTEISSMLTDLKVPGIGRRRLLDAPVVVGHEDYPEWADPGIRRLLAAKGNVKANFVVAVDGSGDFKSIQSAIDKVPKRKNNETFVIHIKEGVYKEYVTIKKSITHLMLIGDGPKKTIISGHKNFFDGITTFKTATVAVTAEHFRARDIGFVNTAGPHKHQAVALRVQADKAIFFNCEMHGYQDTLYVHTMRQFYRDCIVSGTIDFIFGDAAVVFQNCIFLIRKPLSNQQNIVTAHGRKERRQPSALIIQNCTFKADTDLAPVKNVFRSFLGRPWKEYSRTIIMESYIDDVIHPDGWLPWSGDWGLKTCFYTEFRNYGPGSDTSKRVKWRGVKVLTPAHAVDFTASRFLLGDRWIKATGVPYAPGLTMRRHSEV